MRKRFMNNRGGGKAGQMQSVFGWILVLAGGAMFLIFFFFLLKSILTTSERSAEVSGTNLIVSLIRDEAPHAGLSDEMDTARMLSSCTFSETAFRRASGEANPIPVKRIPVFAPSTFDDLFLKVYAADGPLPSGTAVAVFDKQTHIVIMQDNNGFWKRVDKALPENMSKEAVSSASDYSTRKGEKTEFVAFGSRTPSDLSSSHHAEKGDILILIHPVSDLDMPGDLRFYKHDGNGFKDANNNNEPKYMSLYSIIGAIASQDESNYRCGMRKSFERLYYMAKISKKRANTFVNDDSIEDICKDIYGNFEQRADTIIAAISSNVFSNNDAFNTYDYSSFTGVWSDIKNFNNQLLNNGCPLIY